MTPSLDTVWSSERVHTTALLVRIGFGIAPTHSVSFLVPRVAPRLNINVATLLFTLAIGACGGDDSTPKFTEDDAGSTITEPLPDPPRLRPTRLLRRGYLRLVGAEPTAQEYQEVLDKGSESEQYQFVTDTLDSLLDDPRFYDEMIQFARDYMNISKYSSGIGGTQWAGGQYMRLSACADGTLHTGALGVFNNIPRYGDPSALCDDANAVINTVEPWWAPGTNVQVIGRSGTGVRSYNGKDCAQGTFTAYLAHYNDDSDDPGCSCGPNLLYCKADQSTNEELKNSDPNSQRRQAWEEPARLFAHIVTKDRPFSDLVLGDYTVVTTELQHMYMMAARNNSAMAYMDDSDWWRGIGDALSWREERISALNPNFLASRDYKYDDRVNTEALEGVPSAGVLTSMAFLSAFARERVRAARAAEIFACREFVPPSPDAEFNTYVRDPGTEGVCQHCHVLIDPIAIHFKRLDWEFGGLAVAGAGPWIYQDMLADCSYCQPVVRWGAAFVHDTLLTPVSEAELTANPQTRFMDFLQPGQQLFGEQSDGTIGPLGFAKMLVGSGEFDRCAVQKIHKQFVGRELDPVSERGLVEDLTDRFVSGGRQVRPFIKHLMTLDSFQWGI